MDRQKQSKQVIVVNKELEMSPAKVAAQVAHGSIAFLTHKLRNAERRLIDLDLSRFTVDLENEVFDYWINAQFIKVILKANTNEHMLEIIEKAKSLGMKENEDYFVIRDAGYTEVEPGSLTVIGFRPMIGRDVNKVTGNLPLY